MDMLWKEINAAIHRRDTDAVNVLVPKYLKHHNFSPEAIFEASEFFRKITEFKSALRVLSRARPHSASSQSSDIHVKIELQSLRLLNVLGASNYAIRAVDRLRRENKPKSKIEMVEIYHSNYRYEEVITLLTDDYPLPDSEPWHQDWLLYFYLSYALNEVRRTDQAIALIDRMALITGSPLIRAMCLSYKGKYLFSTGKMEHSLELLLQSKQFFSDDDHTADHAILQTFLGECFLGLKRFSEAESALGKALDILYHPGVKPEEWIEIPLLLERIPNLVKKGRELAPRLIAIYGPDYPPLEKVSSLNRVDGPFSILKTEKDAKARHFDRASDIAWVENQARLGLDLIDDLVCNLIYSGQYGLPQFRLYDLLWPNEPFSFDQHQKRLENLVIRARRRGYEIEWKDLHLRLTSKDVTVSSRPDKIVRGRSFLDGRALFTRRDVENYFSVSSTGALRLCKQWLNDGWVTCVSRSEYRVTGS